MFFSPRDDVTLRVRIRTEIFVSSITYILFPSMSLKI
jgi:hypothetical protein